MHEGSRKDKIYIRDTVKFCYDKAHVKRKYFVNTFKPELVYTTFYLVSLVINRVLLKISGRVIDSVVRKSVFNILCTRIKHDGVLNYNRSKFVELLNVRLNANNDSRVSNFNDQFFLFRRKNVLTLLKFRLVVPKSLKETALFW